MFESTLLRARCGHLELGFLLQQQARNRVTRVFMFIFTNLIAFWREISFRSRGAFCWRLLGYDVMLKIKHILFHPILHHIIPSLCMSQFLRNQIPQNKAESKTFAHVPPPNHIGDNGKSSLKSFYIYSIKFVSFFRQKRGGWRRRNIFPTWSRSMFCPRSNRTINICQIGNRSHI